MITFLREVSVELKKVTYPSRDAVVRLTGIVITISVIVGLYLGALDFLFTSLLEYIIQ